MVRRRRRTDVEETRLRKELLSSILSLLVRLIGETVKDRLARTILISCIGAFGYYYDLAPAELEPALQQVEQQK